MSVKTRTAAIGASILLAGAFGVSAAHAAPAPPAPSPGPVMPTPPPSPSPSVSVSPSSAQAGDHVTISGHNFVPGESISVGYGGSTIASSVADGSGSFSANGMIPSSMPEGGHPMDINGSAGSNVTISFTVDAPTAPTPTTPPAPAQPAPVAPSAPAVSAADGVAVDDVAAFDATQTAADASLGSLLPLGLGLLAAAAAAAGIGLWLSRRDRDEPGKHVAGSYIDEPTPVPAAEADTAVGLRVNPAGFQAAATTQMMR